MSKPPFIIPTRKGPDAWPVVTQTPPVATLQLVDTEGLSGAEISRAMQAAREQVAQADSKIRRFYAVQRSMYDNGSTTFAGKNQLIAPGIGARYSRNFAQERLAVMVSAPTMLASLPEAGGVDVFPLDIMWVLDTTGSSGEGTNLPFGIPQAEQTAQRIKDELQPLSRFGVASQGDYPEGSFGSETDMPYYLNSPLSYTIGGWTLRGFDGYDNEEAQYDAIIQCAEDDAVRWAAPIKIIVLSTDTNPHEGGVHATRSRVDQTLERLGMQAFYVVDTSTVYDSDRMRKLKPDVNEVFEAIREYALSRGLVTMNQAV